MEIELKESDLSHVLEVGQEAGTLQGGKGIVVQEDGIACPVDHGAGEHTHQHGGLFALLGQQHDDEQTHEHGDNGQHHLAVLLAHVALNGAGGHGAEEVTHDIEGGGVVVALGIDAGVGAEADVHEHQADGRADTQAHTQGNGGDDLIPDVEHAQQQEHDALHQDDAQGSLEGGGVVGLQHGGDVAADDGKKAVQPHARRHNEGLVGQEGHAGGAHGGGQAGGHEYGLPQGGTGVKICQQVGVQGDDVRHGHEGGQTGNDLRFYGGAVLLQVKKFFHLILSLCIAGFPGLQGRFSTS